MLAVSARIAATGPDRRWLRRRVLAWFERNGRTFPWRERTEPYRVLTAEILLQRTRADLVEPVYERFTARYPDAGSLARADPADVIRLLRPLGFTHRSARLPLLGQTLVERHAGRVPAGKHELLQLPGVGEYVANAVLALAFGERRPLLDPNVIRIIGRATGVVSTHTRARSDRLLWAEVESLLPRVHAREFSLGLIDLGALVCRKQPRCFECPLRTRCVALATTALVPVAP